MAGENPPNKIDPPDKNNIVNKKDEIILYKTTDTYPFEVYIQSKNKNVGNFHNLSIAKEIFQLKFKDIERVARKGKNRLGVTFKNFEAANNFLRNEQLKQKEYEIFIPSANITSKGIVRFVDKSLSDNEIKEFSETQLSNCDILEARRLNRKVIRLTEGEVDYIPTGTVLFTFSGKRLPAEVHIYNLPMQVIPYVGSVVQCRRCLLYGHVVNQCKGKERCKNCGKSHDPSNESLVNPKCVMQCLHCKSLEHESSSKECPEFARQKNIKEIMAFSNKTFFDASQMVPKINKENKFVISEDKFPPLNKNTIRENVIPNQMKKVITANTSNTVKQYSQILKEKSPKKRRTSSSGAFDKKSHDEYLYNPNGRLPNKPSSSESLLNNHREQDQYNTDVNLVMSRLSNYHKDLVMNYIGTLISQQCSDKEPNIFKNKKDNTYQGMEYSEESEY